MQALDGASVGRLTRSTRTAHALNSAVPDLRSALVDRQQVDANLVLEMERHEHQPSPQRLDRSAPAQRQTRDVMSRVRRLRRRSPAGARLPG